MKEQGTHEGCIEQLDTLYDILYNGPQGGANAADHIRRIQSEFPDAQQRQAVLRAQGGVSLGAVLLCMLLLMVGGSAFTLLLGPDLQALLTALAG